MMKTLRDHRNSFRYYDGPVEYLTIRFVSPKHVHPMDFDVLRQYMQYCEDTFEPEAYWVMWSPKTVAERDPRDAVMVAFKCASDAALFLLTHNCGLMRSGHASKGVLYDKSRSA